MSQSTIKSTKNRRNYYWSKIPIVYRGAAILGIPIIAIIPAIASWNWSRQAKADAYWWIDRTQEVIQESNALMQVLIDAETGVRGYTITRKNEFLEPYVQAIKEIPIHVEKIEELTTDNLPQQHQAKIIDRQVETRLSLLAQVLDNIEKSSNLQQSNQLPKLFADGKSEMDDIRDSIDAFKEEEWILLRIHQQRLNKIGRTTNILQGVSIACGLLGYGVAIKLYYEAEKKLEANLKQVAHSNEILSETNELVKERNEELDRFTYIVSHDLKAPLRAISNLSKWIEEDLEDRLDEDTANNMALLRSRVQRMDNFINGLLEYSRVGKTKEEIGTVDVQKLLHEIVDSIAPPPQFVIHIENKMPILQTEFLALHQVFSNLISNAVKHHHLDRGKIVISVQEGEEYYQFSVRDDGVGIAAEHQEKIFIIFQTLAAKDKKENTGIGLSIVKKIVENHGGKIWLESKLHQGTVFHFTWMKIPINNR